jgi:hypothetical protein
MKKPATTPLPTVITGYHGSGVSIESFRYEFTGIGNDRNGSGFYFTTDQDEARGYCWARLNNEAKPGGEHAPTVHCARLLLSNPLPSTLKRNLTRREVQELVEAAPDLEQSMTDWGDVEFEGRQAVMSKIIGTYAPSNSGEEEPELLIKWLFMIANDFYDGETEAFNRAVHRILGFDSVVESIPQTGHAHYVVFFAEQIEIFDRIPGLTEEPITPAPSPR